MFENNKKVQFDEYIRVQEYETLGELLKTIRQSRCETQASLAKKLGTCKQHIQKWEYDLTKPSPKRLNEILSQLRYKKLIDVIHKFYI